MNPSTLLLLSFLLISSATTISGCGRRRCHKHKRNPPPVFPNPPTEPSPSGPSGPTCPIDTLKLGACVDLLGGLVQIGLGNPVMDECCPILQRVAKLEAAICLCTILKLKLLNLNIFVPIALQLLVTCGKSPPPGFTCTLNAAGPFN